MQLLTAPPSPSSVVLLPQDTSGERTRTLSKGEGLYSLDPNRAFVLGGVVPDAHKSDFLIEVIRMGLTKSCPICHHSREQRENSTYMN